MDDDLLGEYSGLTSVDYKLSNHVITRALIFIDEELSIDEQKYSIFEELTQSIGLLNDSDTYPSSVFYENGPGGEKKRYSEMDKDLIRFLYSEKMLPGYREKSVELVIRGLFKERGTDTR